MFTNTEPRSAAAPGSRTFYPGSRLAEISPNLSLIFNVIYVLTNSYVLKVY